MNFELSYGCKGIADYLVAMGGQFAGSGSRRELMQTAFDRFEAHENFLAEKFLGFLRGKASVRIIGMAYVREANQVRVPTISFVVRVSMVHYNTAGEIEGLIAVLDGILK